MLNLFVVPIIPLIDKRTILDREGAENMKYKFGDLRDIGYY